MYFSHSLSVHRPPLREIPLNIVNDRLTKVKRGEKEKEGTRKRKGERSKSLE